MAATLPGASSMVLFFLLSLVAATEALDVPTLTFGDGFSHLFGNDNLIRSADDRSVRLTLNRYSGRGRDVLVATFVVFFLLRGECVTMWCMRFSGSGFISSDLYEHGFFSASIKLPKDYTAGVVVAFYVGHRHPMLLLLLLLPSSLVVLFVLPAIAFLLQNSSESSVLFVAYKCIPHISLQFFDLSL
ncbi:hypothetical protein B296_00042747 [Ensete ventricosum]|uniref:GH16 domain-containing protein n=1 Tax=Ensete ventricosum TaxID=4639 RepID=A0A426ZHA9_ENSVE|nr:hypothetical protein B296_00042747 [Ensete ventricosum]